MSTFLRMAAKVIITLLGGIGAGAVMDKVAADKLPSYTSPTADITPGKSGFSLPKLGYLALAMVVGALALKFIGKKFRIPILK